MSLRNILFMVAAVILLASASAYTVFVIVGAPLGTGVSAERRLSSRQNAPGPIFSVGTMTINLSASNVSSGRVVRAGVAFELDNEKARRELESREEQVKDRIIAVMRQRTPESISTNEGLEELRQLLKDEVGVLVVEGRIVDVYFFDLVVP